MAFSTHLEMTGIKECPGLVSVRSAASSEGFAVSSLTRQASLLTGVDCPIRADVLTGCGGRPHRGPSVKGVNFHFLPLQKL